MPRNPNKNGQPDDAPPAAAEASASQREQAYRGLRRLLILQQLPEGQRLREPEWAKRLGVHRTALREAFARLEAEGLIERGPSTGYFVPELTPEDLAEIGKLRVALECTAIDEICARPSGAPADLAPLEQACGQFEQFVASGYSLGSIEADRRYHEALVDAAGLRRLSQLYHRAPLPIVHRHVEAESTWRQVCDATLAEHREIVDLLKRRKSDEAKAALRRHLNKRSLVPICH